MQNYENELEEATIYLNFLIERLLVGGSRRIQASGYYDWPPLKVEISCELRYCQDK